MREEIKIDFFFLENKKLLASMCVWVYIYMCVWVYIYMCVCVYVCVTGALWALVTSTHL